MSRVRAAQPVRRRFSWDAFVQVSAKTKVAREALPGHFALLCDQFAFAAETDKSGAATVRIATLVEPTTVEPWV